MDESIYNRNKVLDIGVIVVNPLFEALIPDLTKAYPSCTFLKTEDFPRWLTEQKTNNFRTLVRRIKAIFQGFIAS